MKEWRRRRGVEAAERGSHSGASAPFLSVYLIFELFHPHHTVHLFITLFLPSSLLSRPHFFPNIIHLSTPFFLPIYNFLVPTPSLTLSIYQPHSSYPSSLLSHPLSSLLSPHALGSRPRASQSQDQSLHPHTKQLTPEHARLS